jgi:hypothetical protein
MKKSQILTKGQISAFNRDGYVIASQFFNKEETDKLYASALHDKAMKEHAVDLDDLSGRKTRLSLWFTPGDDIFGLMIRSERMVRSAGLLLDADTPVCHFHTKLMQKEPRVGGAWEWHQDYGYWYKDQFMFPDQMVSVMIALTDANKENGCLQVIKGSHKLGRINHDSAGEQVGADMVMVNNALKTMPLEFCELRSGDALFFHSNILHRSEANLSEYPRWSIISVYVSQGNPAYQVESTSWRDPIEVVPNEAFLKWDTSSAPEHDFMRKEMVRR